MKAINSALPLLGVLLILGSSLNQGIPLAVDWTVSPTTRVLETDECYNLIKNLRKVWTGDCEGSYAAMAASAIQDNICIAFDKRAGTPVLTEAQRKLRSIKVSFQEVICSCENCHQEHTMGCLGGDLQMVLNYLKDEGFVGGSDNVSKEILDVTGITWKAGFEWKYNNCLGFFKSYCDFSTEAGCGTPVPFNKDSHCAVAATAGSGVECRNDAGKKIAAVRQKGIFTNFSPRKGILQINQSLNQKGPVVSTMELFSDILTHPATKVYIPRSTISLGHFAVKIVGHFLSATEGDHWLVQLPFDETIGDKGIVRIRAGQNIGELETNAFEIEVSTAVFAPIAP